MGTGFHRDLKCRTLRARLNEPCAEVYVSRIYAYCYEQEQATFGGPAAAAALEDAAEWKGSPGALLRALRDCGFVDCDGTDDEVVFTVHGVPKRLRENLAFRAKNAKRQKEYRKLRSASRNASRSTSHDALRTMFVTSDRQDRQDRQETDPSSLRSEGSSEPLRSSEPALRPVTSMPCVGKGARCFEVTEAMVAEWADAYPGVDVRRQVLRACQWAKDNPTKRKTVRGARAFFSRWLATEQDRGRGGPSQAPSSVSPPEEFPAVSGYQKIR